MKSLTRRRSRKRAVALKLTIVARQLRVSFDQSVEQSGLTRAQWTLIATVARHPGATQRTIAEALEIREITAGRLVDRLCEEGYLKRRDHPNDRRAYSVHLTPAARPLMSKLDELAKIHEVGIFTGFETADLETLDALLDRISRNVSAVRSRDEAPGSASVTSLRPARSGGPRSRRSIPSAGRSRR